MAPPSDADPGVDPTSLSRPAPLPRPTPRQHSAVAAAPWTWSATVPATGTVAWVIRGQLAGWLSALCWPAAAVEDVVFAVSEAVSNASEHAYPPGALDPDIEISAVVEAVDSRAGHAHHPDNQEERASQRLRIRIRDRGSWRPVPPEPGHRGRGLQMMMALMNEVVIHHGGTDGQPGTEVILVSPTVDLAPIRRGRPG